MDSHDLDANALPVTCAKNQRKIGEGSGDVLVALASKVVRLVVALTEFADDSAVLLTLGALNHLHQPRADFWWNGIFTVSLIHFLP